MSVVPRRYHENEQPHEKVWRKRTGINRSEVSLSNSLSINNRPSSGDFPVRFRNYRMILNLTLVHMRLVNPSEIQRRTNDRRSILLTREEESKEISREFAIRDKVLNERSGAGTRDSLETESEDTVGGEVDEICRYLIDRSENLRKNNVNSANSCGM